MQRESLTISHQLTDTRPVSEQWLPWNNYITHSLSFIAERDVIGYVTSLWPVWVSSFSCLFLASYPPQAYTLVEQNGKWRRLRHRAGTAKQQLKHCCIVTIVLVTNPKHTTI